MKKILLFIFLLKFSLTAHAQLTIVGTGPTVTAAALVQKILGAGVNATNIIYSGSQLSKGRFYGASFDSIQSGIILSNGIVNAAIVGNAATGLSDDVATAGDFALDVMGAPLQTFDAAKLEFELTIVSDSLQLEFMYASEDYNDMVNSSYNDLIGIFVSGPGIVGEQNIALLPGTATPVNVNTVNNGQAASGMASGPCMNCQYYVDNDGGNNFAFDGYTVPIIAKSYVQPCQQYHIKIVIADVGDHLNNSAILIREGSLKSIGQIELFADGIAISNNDTIKKCPGDTVVLSVNSGSNYNWSTGSTAQSINVTIPPLGFPPVQYSAYITNPPFYSCFAWTTTIWVLGDTSYCNTTGILNNISKNTLANVIPNPFSKSAVLSFEKPMHELMTLKIVNAMGALIREMKTNGSQFEIQKQNELSGIYFYQISNASYTINYNGKMILEN